MTFLEIRQAIYGALGYNYATIPTEVETRTKAWVLEGHKHVLKLLGIIDLRPITFAFTSVSGTKDYAMAQSLERIEAIVNQSTWMRLRQMTRSEYRTTDPLQVTTGTPTHWIPLGLQPVYLQPSATGLWVASSSAADVTQTVTVQGIDATGVTKSAATAVLTGVARVALGAVTNYNTVIKFDLSAVAAGDVTLYNAAAAGSALGTILIGNKFVLYQIVRLWPTATSTDTYAVDGQMNVYDLSADTDTPLFPLIHHDILVTYGRMREYERTGNTMGYSVAKTEFDTGCKTMRAEVQFPPDYRPVAGVGAYSKNAGWNGLSGWFPADE